MKEKNNYIPPLILNQFRNRKLVLKYSYRFYDEIISQLLQIYKKRRKEMDSVFLNCFNEINKCKDFKSSPHLIYSLYYENIRFFIYSGSISCLMTKIDSINYSKSPVNLIGNIILNKNIISSENISTIDLNVINFKDYIFHSLILNFAKVKYKNYDFKLFIEKYKFLLDHNDINPHFKEILNNLFKFIQRIFLNHQYNDLINFKFRDINHNLNLMKEYDNYLKNSLDITLKELEKEKVTKKYKNVLNALNINLDDFYEIIETRFEDLSYILYSFIDDNNLSEDDNISTYYKKRVSSILSCQEHYLTFIYNINISEVDNKKVFLLFANALKDGIIVETILLLINRRKIKYNVLNSEVDKYLVDLIIEMKSKFTNSFKHLPILFISHYIGLSENQSRNFANDINLSYKISKGKKVGKETVNNIVYKSYFFDLKKTIIKIKLLGIYEFKCVSKDT